MQWQGRKEQAMYTYERTVFHRGLERLRMALVRL